MNNPINNMLNKLSDMIKNSQSSEIDNILMNLGISKDEAIDRIKNIDKDKLSSTINNMSDEDLKKVKNIDIVKIKELYDDYLESKKDE